MLNEKDRKDQIKTQGTSKQDLIKQIQQKTIKSQHQFEYDKFFEDCIVSEKFIITQLMQSNIKFKGFDYQTKNLDLYVSSATMNRNCQVMTLNIKMGPFEMPILILNVQGSSKTLQLVNIGQGQFGSIYSFEFQEKIGAIKSINFGISKQKNLKAEFFQKKLLNAVKEYCFYKIFSALKIGPSVLNYFGFDLICFENCAQFYIELCQKQQKQGNQNENILDDLKRGMKIFHMLQIVHRDIKPDNILYSSIYHKYVFSDFGNAKIIKEKIGQKTLTGFVGSFSHASQDLKELVTKKKAAEYIDMYFNDLFGLQKSIPAIQSTISWLLSNITYPQTISNHYHLYLLKFLFAKKQILSQHHLQFKQTLVTFKSEILNFIAVIEISNEVKNFCLNAFGFETDQKEINILLNAIQQSKKPFHPKNESQFNIFQLKYKQIQNYRPPNFNGQYFGCISKKQLKNLLLKDQQLSKSKICFLYLKFINNQNDSTYEDKVQINNIFAQRYKLQIQKNQLQQMKDILKFRAVLDYIFEITKNDNSFEFQCESLKILAQVYAIMNFHIDQAIFCLAVLLNKSKKLSQKIDAIISIFLLSDLRYEDQFNLLKKVIASIEDQVQNANNQIQAKIYENLKKIFVIYDRMNDQVTQQQRSNYLLNFQSDSMLKSNHHLKALVYCLYYESEYENLNWKQHQMIIKSIQISLPFCDQMFRIHIQGIIFGPKEYSKSVKKSDFFNKVKNLMLFTQHQEKKSNKTVSLNSIFSRKQSTKQKIYKILTVLNLPTLLNSEEYQQLTYFFSSEELRLFLLSNPRQAKLVLKPTFCFFLYRSIIQFKRQQLQQIKILIPKFYLFFGEEINFQHWKLNFYLNQTMRVCTKKLVFGYRILLPEFRYKNQKDFNILIQKFSKLALITSETNKHRGFFVNCQMIKGLILLVSPIQNERLEGQKCLIKLFQKFKIDKEIRIIDQYCFIMFKSLIKICLQKQHLFEQIFQILSYLIQNQDNHQNLMKWKLYYICVQQFITNANELQLKNMLYLIEQSKYYKPHSEKKHFGFCAYLIIEKCQLNEQSKLTGLKKVSRILNLILRISKMLILSRFYKTIRKLFKNESRKRDNFLKKKNFKSGLPIKEIQKKIKVICKRVRTQNQQILDSFEYHAKKYLKNCDRQIAKKSEKASAPIAFPDFQFNDYCYV